MSASVEALRERMAELCAGAVDALEVTAGLEAEGVNDEAAKGYGHPDVFALAEDLYARTPRRPPPVEETEAPWRPEPLRHLLRGVLFGLPGLCYVSGAQVLDGTGAGVLLVFSLLLSWAFSQGTAYLGYIRLGLMDRAAASGVLRYGLAAGTLVVVPATVGAGALLGAGTMATALSAGLAAYLLAATAVQVDGAEVWLLPALLPGVAAAALFLAGHGPPAAVRGAWAVSLAATAVLALLRTRGAGRPKVTRADLRAALPFALSGVLTGGLLTYTLLCALAGRPVPSGTTTAAVLSLSLSMGCAEWILYAYRRRVHHLLRSHTGMAGFTRAARAALARALLRYLAALLAITAVAAVAARLPATAVTARTLGGFAALGCAFFLALVLQACGRVGAALAGYGCTLAAEVAAATALPDTAPATVQLAAACGLLVLLTIHAGRVLARATSHR